MIEKEKSQEGEQSSFRKIRIAFYIFLGLCLAADIAFLAVVPVFGVLWVFYLVYGALILACWLIAAYTIFRSRSWLGKSFVSDFHLMVCSNHLLSVP